MMAWSDSGPDDESLRQRFRDLEAEEGDATPRFRLPQPPRRGPWPATRVAFAAAAVVAVAGGAAVSWLSLRSRPVPYPIDLEAVIWTGPTDFLLETPGAALLRELPTIGTDRRASVPDQNLIDDTLRRNRS